MSKKGKILILVVILALMLVGVGFYQFNKKVPTLHNTQSAYQLSADELFDLFDADEQAAATKFENKIVEVSGKIVSIKKKDQQNNIVLEAKNAMAGGINCSMREISSEVKEGQVITIKGQCQGFLMDVVLNNCYVVKN